MADFVFNIAKGAVKYYASLPAANDALVVVPIKAAGLEADAALRDHDNLSLLLAGTTDEDTGLGRKTITTTTVTVDDVNERVDIDVADQTWVNVAVAVPLGALLICYDPDTTTGTDADLIPLTKHDWVVTPNAGANLSTDINASGFFRAQ